MTKSKKQQYDRICNGLSAFVYQAQKCVREAHRTGSWFPEFRSIEDFAQQAFSMPPEDVQKALINWPRNN